MAAPEFTLFVKPYLEGWDNGEEGNTPITAEILNENYDAFLLALNEWATSVGLILDSAVTDPNYVHTDNNYTTTEKNKLSGIEANANNYSLPTASASTLGGVKVDGITITIANGVISANIGDEVEGNPSGQATVQLLKLKIGNTIYSIPEGGGVIPSPTGITYDFTYTAASGGRLEIIQYTDGVQTDTDYVSYSESAGGVHPGTADVGDVEITYDNASHSYKIISKDASNILAYNNVNYEYDETILSIDRFVQETDITGTVTEIEFVSVENLDDLLDVDISSVSNGQVLMYDSTTQKWKNAASPSGTDVEGNPSGTPSVVLTAIRIGNMIYSIPGGSSGGSTVSYSQILATGTKIGTITIDGVPTDIYAPTAPTKTSDLTNDSNFVSDASYVHTDNNYTTTEKNKLADLNQVEANPSSGTSAGDLTSIEIDGTKYNIPSGGGGGTTVVANPSGAATAGNLNKLQVGNDIYAIPSSGDAHTVVQYIESTGTQYINTGLNATEISKILIDCSLEETPNAWGCIFGSQGDYTTGNASFILTWNNNRFSFRCGTSSNQIDMLSTVTLHQRYLFECINSNGSISFSVDENSQGTGTSGTLSLLDFWLFKNNANTTELNQITSLKLYSCKIYGQNSQLIADYEPCVIDNEVCLYNKVTHSYLRNIGTGSFIAGPEVTPTSSGHTILNDAGTSLAQEDNLQFKGVYSHDDSTNGKTIVEVTRVMTSAEYLLLTEPEKKGVIVITDEEPAPVGSTDIIGTLAAGETSITLSSPAITPDSSIEPWTDTYGVVPTNMEIVQSSSVADKEIILERYADYTVGMTITIKDALGTVISTETIDGQTQTSYSNPYVIDGYLSLYYNSSNYRWVITFLKDCEDNGVEKHANDTVDTHYGPTFVTQDIEYFTLGYGVQMTFEARQAALGVKVRIS